MIQSESYLSQHSQVKLRQLGKTSIKNEGFNSGIAEKINWKKILMMIIIVAMIILIKIFVILMIMIIKITEKPTNIVNFG